VPSVSAARLGFTRALAALYRVVLSNQVYTPASCFRVYRRSRMLPITLRRGGVVGLTELLARLQLSGGEIVEHPVRRDARIFGRSKLGIVRSVAGHVGFLAQLLWERALGRRTS